MDTVTEHEMAIALAKEGGIGVIHKNMSVEQQTEEVNKVKRSANGIILDPVTLRPDEPVSRAQEMMKQKNVSGFPITDAAAASWWAFSPGAICGFWRTASSRSAR